MQKFLKFKCGFLAENGRYSAEKWPTKSGLPQILTKIFFITKSQKLMILSRKVEPPPPPQKKWPFFFFFWGGGGRKLYTTYPRYHLSSWNAPKQSFWFVLVLFYYFFVFIRNSILL